MIENIIPEITSEDIGLELLKIYEYLLEEANKPKTEAHIRADKILYDNLWDLYL